MSSYYPKNTSDLNIPKLEKNILKFWQEKNIFKKSVDNRTSDEWVFYDGPPFANGLPHYGHLLTSCVKDIFARYHTMQGKKVERRFGWDCHGLPAEMGVEKELGIQGQIAIQEFGIKEFNERCRESVLKYTDQWQFYVNRQARWVDFDNDYKTMDISYMESVMWAFSELHKKGLVYKGFKVMPYSWACETPLSNFETRMDNSYREREDKAITVKFALEEIPNVIKEKISDGKKVNLLAWTTTPWTLPSNLALGVNPEMEYEFVEEEGEIFIKAATEESENKIKGEELVGLKYQPLFPYFKDTENAFYVLSADFVEEGSGTGIVHLAPGFGEDDQRVCSENNIATICAVDEKGRFTSQIYDLAYGDKKLVLQNLNVVQQGVDAKTDDDVFNDKQIKKYGLANLRIIFYLKQTGSLVKEEIYSHNYPHCWRTDTPLIYKAVPSWYVAVTKFKSRMVELNQNINWIPGHVKDGLFGKWLENAHDWAISRNRFWGAPIPVWQSDNPEDNTLYVYSSIAELEKDFDVEVKDLHRPFIDTLTRPDPKNPKYTLRRVPEVLDCWFESGSMPFAQVHYPFENKDWFEKHFPADFIVEYTAQTRGWFYTLMILATALFDKEPFKNCICHGVILDENSQKLSKRLKNYPDPKEVYEEYGADAMRLMMVKAPVMCGGILQVAKDGGDIRDVVRLSIRPIWNAYHFFCLYVNSDKITAKNLLVDGEFADENLTLLDRYILTKLKFSVTAIAKALDNFDTPTACKNMDEFFEVLNNWYIRRNRERFWREVKQNDFDKQSAYNTLYTCLLTMVKAVAPLLPFVSEQIFSGLKGKNIEYNI